MRTNKEHVAIRETSESAAYFMEFEVEDGGRGRRSGLRFVLSFSPFDGLLRYGGFLVRVWVERAATLDDPRIEHGQLTPSMHLPLFNQRRPPLLYSQMYGYGDSAAPSWQVPPWSRTSHSSYWSPFSPVDSSIVTRLFQLAPPPHRQS